MSGQPWWFNDSASDQVVWRFSGFDTGGNLVDFEFAGPNANSATVLFKPLSRIGRDPARCDIVIQDPTISRLHAELYFFPGEGVKIRDLGSANGTYINGERIYDNYRPIGVRSAVTIGRLELTVSVRR
ncbi:MAG: FHA domain-containing protein [Rhodomicrobium sp.]|nr:FHA domain-containing protein [Rhodomicrobium sp.]